MIPWLITRRLRAFEASHTYDMAYAHDLLDTGLDPFLRWAAATGLGGYRRGVPLAPWHAAKIAALQHEDCGACVQLAVQLAAADGLSQALLADILGQRAEGLPDDVALALAFTRAVLSRSDTLDTLRADVVAAFGRQGLVSLTFALMSSRLYPDLKRALGYAGACALITLGDEVVGNPGAAVRDAG